jgi:hypothetical protein
MRQAGAFSLEVLIALGLNLAASLFTKPQAIAASKFIWLVVLVHATYLLISSARGKRYNAAFRARIKRPFYYWAAASIALVIVLLGYRSLIDKVYVNFLYPHRMSLPGMSLHAEVRLRHIAVDRRKYIFDIGHPDGERLSIYISPENIFTLIFLDPHKEPYIVQVPFGGSSIPLEQWFYLDCEVGSDGYSSEVLLFSNGEQRGSLELPFRVNVNSLDVPGGVIGADLDGNNGGAFDLSELAVYSNTLPNEAASNLQKYFAELPNTHYVEFGGNQWMRINQVGKHDATQKDASHSPIFRVVTK